MKRISYNESKRLREEAELYESKVVYNYFIQSDNCPVIPDDDEQRAPASDGEQE